MSWWHQPKQPPLDVNHSWKAEGRKGKRSRRQRYARKNYVRLVDLEPWTIYFQNKFDEDVHTPKPTPAEQPEQTPAVDVKTETDTKPEGEKPVDTKPEETKAEAEKPVEADAKPVDAKPADVPAAEKPAEEESSESSSEEWPKANKLINRKVTHWNGDICKLEIDAVVNAANTSLLGGGGIDGAIHSAAGDTLYRECLTLNGTPTGTTKITRGYNLPAKYILHTVGPRCEDPEKLTGCYTTVLELVKKYGIRSVALCGISTGIFGYPLEPASRIACEVVRKWLEIPENFDSIDRIIFCTFLPVEEKCYDRLFQEYFPIESDPEFVGQWKQYVDGYESTEELTQPSTSSSEESEEEEPPKPTTDDKPNVSASSIITNESENVAGSESEDEKEYVVWGAATLVKGEATVVIEDKEFLDKCTEFYYQLTCVGKWAPLYIKEELKDGKFVIGAGDGSDGVAHWQVRGESW